MYWLENFEGAVFAVLGNCEYWPREVCTHIYNTGDFWVDPGGSWTLREGWAGGWGWEHFLRTVG